MNKTLGPALRKALRENRASFVDRCRVNLCLAIPAWHRKLEFVLTEWAVANGHIPPTAEVDSGGCLVGDWVDFLQILIDNLPAILEFVIAIISLF